VLISVFLFDPVGRGVLLTTAPGLGLRLRRDWGNLREFVDDG
jgi:hypothetical protein